MKYTLLVLLLVSSFAANSLTAFIGAQGGGAQSIGGRGGQVIKVTTLANSGAGSLRECVMVRAPRTCVFSVGGTIHLTSPLVINTSRNENYLTIAGQTAPGGGIQLESAGVLSDLIDIAAHDIIIRHVKLRKGHVDSCVGNGCGSNIEIFDGYNIMLDHLSMYWARDDNLNIWPATEGRNITAQYSIIAEGLAPHGTGVMIGNLSKANIDLHHNVFTSFHHRVPNMTNTGTRLVNNIFHNMSMHNVQLYQNGNVDAVSNIFSYGPNSSKTFYEFETTVDNNASLYLSGNIGPHQASPTGDQWAMARTALYNGAITGVYPPALRRGTPTAVPAGVIAITAESVTALPTTLLPIVGDSMGLSCSGAWVLRRDTTDVRLINQVIAKGGNPVAAKTEITSEEQVGGYPTIAGGTACSDKDGDNLPDAYEELKGLNPNNPDNWDDIASNGYSHFENYINGH